MSWWVYLTDPVSGETLELDEPHHMKGGTYAHGGTAACELNVTYNYSALLAKALQGSFLALEGKTARATIPQLEAAAASLRPDDDPDYWAATEGNVLRCLLNLLTLARQRPDGVWRIS